MKLVYTLLGLMLLTSPLQADSITTIQLQNRPAEEIIPIIEPMLGTGDVITGRGFKLFLRSSPETLAEVKDMIDVLDITAKILQISVFQGSERDLRALSINGNIQIESGNASGSIGTKSNQSAGSISYDNNNTSGSINATGTSGRMQNNPLQRLRVTAGTEGYIETGEQIPYFSVAGWIGSRAAVGDIEYRNVTTGFYVLPRVHGDNVSLQVSPFKNSLRKTRTGNIATQQANTTITGRLGEWLLIGGATEQITRSQSGIGNYSSTQNRTNAGIWIKADLTQ
jgi:type II secretory pathway component HofQ